MGLKRKHWMLVAAVAGLAAVLALLGPRLAGPALGQATTVRVVSPGTASVGSTVGVEIRIENVANLGSYEWFLTYDPNILELAAGTNPVNGDFLASSGRSVFCASPDPSLHVVGTVWFGCVSSDPTPGDGNIPPGPTGSGLLSTVSFKALASGSSSLCLSWVSLSDASFDVNDIPAQVAHDSIAVGGSSAPPAPCEPAATPTPATPPPDYTPPAPTETPVTPAGPTPTPAPTPPPEQSDWVELAAVCNPVTTTYPDGTTVQTLAAAIAPPETLVAMWKFEGGFWLGYSPEFPQVSDLAVTSFLDVVFFCVDAPATFVRPLV